MDERTKIFQYALMALFMGLAVLAVIIFANTQNTSQNISVIPVSIWGTLDKTTMSQVMNDLKETIEGLDNVSYVEVDERNYYETIVEAIATGQGPDLFMVDNDTYVPNLNKMHILTFENYPLQNFRNTFTEGGEVFLYGGVAAIPFMVDPLVMYWNRDLFTNAGIPQPPKFWDEFYQMAPRLTQVTDDLAVIKSAVALGEYDNVTHAKQVISAMMMQAGSPITGFGLEKLESRLNTIVPGSAEPAAVSTMRFYTEFANPIKTIYSWNRSLEPSRDAFIAGDLAVYFGYLSETPQLSKLNPNLNMAIAPFPQTRGGNRRLTGGKMVGLAIPRTSRNIGGAFQVALAMTGPAAQGLMVNYFSTPPVRRDMLAQPQVTPYWSVAYDSALIAKTWIDPAPERTEDIFKKMVNEISSGASVAPQAVRRADQELANILR